MVSATRRAASASTGVRARGAAVLALALASAALTVAAPLAAPAAAAPDPAPAPEPRTAARGLRIDPGADGLTVVGGPGGGRRHAGVVELLPRGQGLEVVVDLPLDGYLHGIAEVPPSWPTAALEAQAIAARTYAWYVLRASSYADYDICATVACQVYRGAEVVLGPDGDRWRDAVDATSGQVLLYDGAPILARYFSTSGGRTYPNEFVFPSSGPRPYLVGVEDPFDALSPLHRWEVRFPRADFDLLLAEGRTLGRVAPVATVTRLGAVDDPRATLRFVGRNGRRTTVTALAFRDFVSAQAPRLFPDRYPPLRADGQRRLPATIPTTRYDVVVTGDEVVISGLGWGHGVGMGQWGAHGRALAGADATEILAAYYAGLTPTTDAGLPERIRVGLGRATDSLAGGGLRVTLLQPTVLRDLDGTELGTSLGTWRVDRARGADGTARGAALVLLPPAGEDEPLEASAPVLTPGFARRAGERYPDPVHPVVAAELTVTRPVLLRLVVTRVADGSTVLTEDLGLAERGTHRVLWWLDTTSGLPAAPGAHLVTVLATDALGAEGGGGALHVVPEPPLAVGPPAPEGPDPSEPAPAPAPAPDRPARWAGAVRAAVGLAVLGAVLAGVRRVRGARRAVHRR
jgi:SpoIID/LytB domain protein